MEIKRNVTSQYSQTGRPKNDPLNGAQALTSVDRVKATMEKQEKLLDKTHPGISVEQERAAAVGDIIGSSLKVEPFNIDATPTIESEQFRNAQKEREFLIYENTQKALLNEFEKEIKDKKTEEKIAFIVKAYKGFGGNHWMNKYPRIKIEIAVKYIDKNDYTKLIKALDEMINKSQFEREKEDARFFKETILQDISTSK